MLSFFDVILVQIKFAVHVIREILVQMKVLFLDRGNGGGTDAKLNKFFFNI